MYHFAWLERRAFGAFAVRPFQGHRRTPPQTAAASNYNYLLINNFSPTTCHYACPSIISCDKGEDRMQAVKYYNKRNPLIKTETAVVLSLILGIALGVAVCEVIPQSTLAAFSGINATLSSLQNGDWLHAFVSSFIFAEVFVVIMYLIGFGAIFQPVSLILCAVRGVGLGVCVRGIYSSDNVLLNLAAFLPFAVASTLVILSQAKQSIKMAGYYFSLTVTSENRLGVKTEIHDYTAKFVILTIVLAIFSALNCLLLRLIDSALI